MSFGTLQAQGHRAFAVSVAFAATAATPASKPSTPPGVPKSVAAFRRSDGGAFFRSHFRASRFAAANGSQVPSPHGTVPAGQGAAMRTETAAADTASGMRRRIDENCSLYLTLQPTNDAIYARNERPGVSVR